MSTVATNANAIQRMNEQNECIAHSLLPLISMLVNVLNLVIQAYELNYKNNLSIGGV